MEADSSVTIASKDIFDKVSEAVSFIAQYGSQEDEVWGIHFKRTMKVDKLAYGTKGRTIVTFRVHTEPWMKNGHDIVHGGCIATIVDWLTSLGVVAHKKFWPSEETTTEQALLAYGQVPAVSRHISVQYIKAVPLNKDILVECTIESNTKRYSYINCRILDDEGNLYVTGSHDRVHLYGKI
jgi:acyl-coenzyme A thioesterase PaaI-like protein